MFLGKIFGGLIGFFALGSFGLSASVVGVILGVFVGHYFDRGRAEQEGNFNPQLREEIESAFKASLFPIMGMLAKADGRVCENEISGAEQLMAQLGIKGSDRQIAISAFQSGVAGTLSIETILDPFIRATGKRRDLHQIYLVYLLTIAFADGSLHHEEEALLSKIAERLGYSRFAFNRLVGMIKAQSFFYQRQQERASHSQNAESQNTMDNAYEALGVSPQDSDAQIKRAYRKLMSEYHPDKLAGRGVPEEMLKVATERSQEIQVAYDVIKKSRQSKP